MYSLDDNIRYLKGVGEKRAKAFNSLGIDTVGALLRFYPRDYEDLSEIRHICDCFYDEKVCVKAKITSPVTEHYIRENMTLYKFTVSDGTAGMTVTLFNNKFLAKRLNVGSTYLFYGKMTGTAYSPNMSSPEIREENNTGIIPIYKSSKTITSKQIEKAVRTALDGIEINFDTIPERIRQKNNLCDLNFAIRNIHFPKTKESFERAKTRLTFEELFVLQLGLMLLKNKRKTKTDLIFNKNFLDDFLALLPFSLTNAQQNAISDCLKDMQSGFSMNRLIEGDVGSGKTAVATALMYIAAKNGFQSALMAPTEVLAAQHFETVNNMLKNTDIKVVLLSGSITAANKKKIKEDIKNKNADIIIGTHALLTEDTVFDNLALVITDEQHRFGVSQRAALAKKGENVHTLVMSATPIPRTLGLIIYGDLDISIINEYPKGRQKTDTYFVTSDYRKRLYNFILEHIKNGRQAYIVCPLVEESENSREEISAVEYYNELIKSDVFKNFKIGLLHGKMKSKEKDAVMQSFSNGEIDILVSTTVIEVGIDVPNATVMIIENAERFGLSQLHQLRGRIGRGEYKSTCVLISDTKSETTKERLNVIKNNMDGFKIADEDLKLRGPGDFLGQRQHGLPELKIADLFANSDILKLCGMTAAYLLEKDPKLKESENLPLRKEIIALYKRLNEN